MRSVAVIFCAIVILFSFSQVQATIIHVPGDSSTIQGGINGATDGTNSDTQLQPKKTVPRAVSEIKPAPAAV
ncbi:MAG: hypothetical protein KAV87_48160 [Desulfobacteraceae bacterium]|nr:hypothetical protein [Desulfobacteraceae bacterium]